MLELAIVAGMILATVFILLKVAANDEDRRRHP